MEGRVACSTCHRRKVKCDRRLPRCSACERLQLECGRTKAASRLAWVESRADSREDGAAEPDTCARRRALFSDAEREAECVRLLGQVGHQQIDSLLQELDSSRVLDKEPQSFHFSGPFGVFCVKHDEVSVAECAFTDTGSNVQLNVSAETDHDTSFGNPAIGTMSNTLAEKQLVDYVMFDQGPLASDFSLTHLDDLFDLSNANMDIIPLPADHDGFQETTDLDVDQRDVIPAGRDELFNNWRSPSPLAVSIPLHFANDFGNISPTIATALLAHYRDKMIPFFLGHQHHKPPWKILHLPTALAAYGEISLLGDTNNAKASLFLSILAMSAFNLEHLRESDDESPSQWCIVGEMYRDKAKQRLQACLREQGGVIKKAKYKEVLMAILSMVTTCVVTGQMEDARYFLLDAERFIYLHGLPKVRKSRKVLMLHGIFLYLRVVEESTCICTASTQALPKPVYHHLSNDGSFSCRYPTLWTERLRISLRLEMKESDSLEMQLMAFPTNAEEPTVFEHIYGIPESLFRSISHATYLANAIQYNGDVSNKELDQCIKALETKICNWKNPYRLMPMVGPSRSPDGLEAQYSLSFHFLEAIHSALMIYFYRRVRDMNTVALQHYVAKTIHHLLEHERKKNEAGDTSASFCWPGFIAACEALDLEQRQSITGWLSRSAKSSGLGMFDTARDVTAKLWKARGTSGNPDISWQDMLANGKTALILS